ncbi:MAG TPA: EthD family reductase [Candidatus Acidoferrales bacterium]|nr:EthD family reductase [Candidatus Acidoferrales bacterium]
MIKVGVFYPQSEGSKFDMKYYLEKHIPMVRQKIGSALKSVSVEQGLAGGSPGAPITYVAIGHLTFDSVDAFQAAFGAKAPEIMADVPNYTNIQPIVQISEVKL